ncbi:DUF1080 domain-containing protein [Flammeovirgaceae bacterium SG7u.111]|nr:DUF1080 domain-containing protein [Flammeovirgaceae bacterium SG7u.132]WPO38294.1 DUF1080 domain-containing protein [Flammeovirgaceae bacterium SG7u.111]
MKTFYLLLLVPLLVFCTAKKDVDAEEVAVEEEIEVEILKEKWISLFDGKTTEGWHNYLKDNVNGWEVENGVLFTKGGSGDLVSDAEFENFELVFEWRIDEKCNSGVFFNIIEDPKYSTPYLTAPEYQLIDDEGYPAELEEGQKTGANYALHPPSVKANKPAGEWNTGKIIVNQGKVEHWLNGQQTVSYELWIDEWKELVASTKFKDMPEYGKANTGPIGLQDHGDAVYFKSIKIKKL